ncbi:MAG: hypothetical protein NVSMB18_22310 [Acetobacteraceae bacterium]
MQNRGAWIAFLLMCFVVTGMTGLFASYSTSVPFERALLRGAVLDQALVAGSAPDAGVRLEALRPALGRSAEQVLSGPGDIASRVAAARASMLDEQRREANSVGYRTRLMLFIVTFLAAGLGAGLLLLATRSRQ